MATCNDERCISLFMLCHQLAGGDCLEDPRDFPIDTEQSHTTITGNRPYISHPRQEPHSNCPMTKAVTAK